MYRRTHRRQHRRRYGWKKQSVVLGICDDRAEDIVRIEEALQAGLKRIAASAGLPVVPKIMIPGTYRKLLYFSYV